MRTLIGITLLGFGLFHAQDLMEIGQVWIHGEEDPHTLAALEVRCGDEPLHMRDQCESELRDDFERGRLVPGEIVRRHCTHFDNRWASEAALALPAICEEDLAG